VEGSGDERLVDGLGDRKAQMSQATLGLLLVRRIEAIAPSRLAKATLLSQEPRIMLPDLPPRFECPWEGSHVSESQGDLEPGEITGGFGSREREGAGPGTTVKDGPPCGKSSPLPYWPD
jgi:hypothetical protein